MFLTENPMALPGTCLRCPGSQRRRYIDTDIHQEFYGAVYLCDECVIEMGRMLGMLTREQSDDLLSDMEAKNNELFDLKRKVAGLEAAVRGLADAGFEPVPQRSGPDVLPPDVEGQRDLPPLFGEFLPGKGDIVGEGEGTTPEPSDDEQLDGVRSDGGGGGGDFRLTL